jgi:hypothetical protein
VGLKLNCTHQLIVCVDDLNLSDNKINTIKKNTGPLVDGSKEVSVVVNTKKTNYALRLVTRILDKFMI